MTTETNTKIAAILDARRKNLPTIEREIDRWAALQQQTKDLESAVAALRAGDQVQAGMSGFFDVHFSPVFDGISSALSALDILKNRLLRDTLNIGVSGSARVGKSTLLQSIAGLGDDQIPTGSGLPVTAVRSRIFHSSQERATLSLHTYETFRRDVLEPYHSELGLPAAPQTLAEFRAYAYPASEKDLGEKGDRHSTVTLLRRLKEMHDALSSYETDLVGGERSVSLSDLRPYVAYPSHEQIESGQVSRRYLAVRDVRIECLFPYAQVKQLGIIDLPGLGELAANAEKHHVAGLQNEVDLVLLVKRPVEGKAYWGNEDGAAADLLEKAKGLIKNRRDFVSIVLNTGGADATLRNALVGAVLRDVNDGEDGKHFQVFETNATKQQAVYEQVLAPVLQHLADRLPVMDQQIIDGTRQEYEAAAQRVRGMLEDLERNFGQAKTSLMSASAIERVIKLARDLHRNLAADLKELLKDLKKKARSKDSETGFEAAVEEAYSATAEWIKSGMGRGSSDEWCNYALREFQVKNGSSGFANDECNRIRAEIGNRFASIDGFFQVALDGLWDKLNQDVLGKNLGKLLQGAHGKEAIATFAAMLDDAQEPCPNMQQALFDLLNLRLDYRTQLHPRVRESLDGLEDKELDPDNIGKMRNRFTPKEGLTGAKELYREISQLAEQTTYQTKKALYAEMRIPALVIHAAVEQFDDNLIRAGDSEDEFGRLARSFRDDIWPGEFAQAEAANARVAKMRSLVKVIRQELNAN